MINHKDKIAFALLQKFFPGLVALEFTDSTGKHPVLCAYQLQSDGVSITPLFKFDSNIEKDMVVDEESQKGFIKGLETMMSEAHDMTRSLIDGLKGLGDLGQPSTPNLLLDQLRDTFRGLAGDGRDDNQGG